MKQLSNITRALADENRIRILAALEVRELCVCQITELLRLAPSTVSKHLLLLRHAGLIDSRKDGRWIYYRLSEAPGIVSEWLQVLLKSTKVDKTCCQDRKALRVILKMDTEELCSRRRKKSRT